VLTRYRDLAIVTPVFGQADSSLHSGAPPLQIFPT
jgi:hypothetical protein